LGSNHLQVPLQFLQRNLLCCRLADNPISTPLTSQYLLQYLTHHSCSTQTYLQTTTKRPHQSCCSLCSEPSKHGMTGSALPTMTTNPQLPPMEYKPFILTPSPTALPHSSPVDLPALQQPIFQNMVELDWLFQLPKPTTMMTLQPRQTDSTLLPTTPVSTTLHAIQQREPQQHNNMDNQANIFPLVSMLPQSQTMTLAQTPAPPATSTRYMVILSHIERLLHNTCTRNSLGTSDAFLQSPHPN